MRVVRQNNRSTAKNILEKGGILAVPTETVYGLAVKADNPEAIKKLLTLKDRPVGGDKVLTMMLANVAELPNYIKASYHQLAMAKRYFPGELTLILPKQKTFKHPYFDYFDKIGVRIPAHDYMLDLLQETGPLLVTSANPRGEAPCRNYRDVLQRLDGIDGVVSGKSGGNIPSTIIDWSTAEPQVLRQGGLLLLHL